MIRLTNSGQLLKIVSEYDQEIPQSQTADKPMAPRERATQNWSQINGNINLDLTIKTVLFFKNKENKLLIIITYLY